MRQYCCDLRLQENIERYIASAAKFEFYLISKDCRLAKTDSHDNVQGVCWDELAQQLESRKKFHEFDQNSSGFAFFWSDEPKKLMLKSNGGVQELDWRKQDGGASELDGWLALLTTRLHRLRCNVAHGSKALPPQGDQTRSKQFLLAGWALMSWIAEVCWEEPDWEKTLVFY